MYDDERNLAGRSLQIHGSDMTDRPESEAQADHHTGEGKSSGNGMVPTG
jgi:hypothetical protein